MSGCYITTVAARFPHRMTAAASLYGINIGTDKSDSSHLPLPKVRGELYYAFAEHDQSVPEHVTPELRASLAKTNVINTVKVFDGTHHGFCFAERMVYNAQAAEPTWSDIFDLWKRRLG
jgi:carboxymethylenebutenolidase